MKLEIKLYIKYTEEINRICNYKGFGNKIKRILSAWLEQILLSYSPSVNFLDKTPLDKYLSSFFRALEKAESIKAYSAEEIYQNPNCKLYKNIIKIPENKRGKISIQLRKQGNLYIKDPNGEYYLSATGICTDSKKIELVENKSIIETFHHELKHVNQRERAYLVPSIFPFSYDINVASLEGEAEYERTLIRQNLWKKELYYPIEQMQIYPYNTYYKLYFLLNLVFSVEFRKEWKKGRLEVSMFSSPVLLEKATDIFSLYGLIAAKLNEENTEEDFIASFKRCYTDSRECLKNLEIENQSFGRNMENEKRKVYYKFIMDMTMNMKIYEERNLSLQDLFYLYVLKITDFLIESKEENMEEKLAILMPLKKLCEQERKR